jgi:predicted membrane channel-forming protein YqfA (hemolysin III family)/ribosomal protein L37E
MSVAGEAGQGLALDEWAIAKPRRAMNDGMGLILNAPHDPRVWYAPETLAWCALLLLAPLALMLLVTPWMYAKLDADQKSKAVSREGAAVFADPGFRITLVAFVGAMFLAVLDAVMVVVAGDMRNQTIVLTVRVGLPAAATLLSTPAFAAAMASFVSLLFVIRYRAATRGTGLLPVIWLLCGGAGCLVAAPMALAEHTGPTVVVVWLVLGGVLLLAGVARWATATPRGVSISTRVHQAVQEEHLAEATESAKEAPAQGVYMGAPALVYWGRLAVPALFFGSFAAVGPWLLSRATNWPASADIAFVLVATGFGAAIAPLAWLISARHALLVQWNEEGVTVTWYRGPARRYRWDELALLRTGYAGRGNGVQIGEGGNYATVRTATGENWTIWQGKSGYRELLDALKAHLWARGEGKTARGVATAGTANAEPATECKWCGEAFPVGTARCPQCGRPVPQQSDT